MSSIERRGSSYRVTVRKNGVRESATFPTLREAKAWGAARETDIERTGRGGLPNKTGIDLLKRYGEEEEAAGTDTKWTAIRVKSMQNLAWAKKRLEDVTSDDMAKWRNDRQAKVSDGTVLREMGFLHALFERARKEWGWLHDNPLEGVKRPKEPPPRKRLIAQHEIDEITKTLGYHPQLPVTSKGQQVAVMLLLALETAMRAGELQALQWSDVREKSLTIRESKNGDARDVPLSSVARSLFNRLRHLPKPFTVGEATRDALFRDARNTAKLSGFTFHDSRANALTMLSKKLDVLELARMVGHRDPRSLMIYFRKSADDIAERLG